MKVKISNSRQNALNFKKILNRVPEIKMFHRIIIATGLLICAAVFYPSASERIPKCCPRSGYELASDLFGEHSSRSSLLSCMLIQEEDSQEPPFYGLQVNDSDVPSRLPVCPATGQVTLHRLEEMRMVRLPLRSACVDLVEGSYLAVICQEDVHSPVQDPVPVYTIRKCCPVNHLYDDEWSECRELNGTFHEVPVSPFWAEEPRDIQLIKSLANDFNAAANRIGQPFFHQGIPKCSASQVLVTYRMRTNEFQMLHNKIIIPKSQFSERNLNVFTSHPEDPFCIDSVAPSTISPPEAEADPGNITWIVRVCRPLSVCDRIPCVRKCCGPHERYARRNNETVCEPFAKDLVLTFHDLEAAGGEGEEVAFPEDPEPVHRPGENR